jgi:predicted MPP superfamily phosphohydrolase
VAAGTPRLVLTHSPDPVREAAARGLEAVLAGHTHGGQVRVPGFGALLTRTRLGRRYDRGLFLIRAPAGGATRLYVNPGVGTSHLPMRFFDPPGWAVVGFAQDSPSHTESR